jgi:hypothetical protein
VTDSRDDKLTAAIDQALREYNADDDQTFITGWVLVTAEIDPTNESSSGIGLQYPHGIMAWTTALGIIEAAKLRLASQWQREA